MKLTVLLPTWAGRDSDQWISVVWTAQIQIASHGALPILIYIRAFVKCKAHLDSVPHLLCLASLWVHFHYWYIHSFTHIPMTWNLSSFKKKFILIWIYPLLQEAPFINSMYKPLFMVRLYHTTIALHCRTDPTAQKLCMHCRVTWKLNSL